MQFATAAELAARLGVSFSAEEETRADSLLTLASGLIQREARQDIGLVEDDVFATRATREQSILLPERPVVSVSSVTVGGSGVTDWYLDGDELVRRSGWEVSLNGIEGTAGWGSRNVPLVVTYTHGYNPVPDAIKAVCLEAVTRVWVNPGSVMSERYGSEQVAYLTQGTPTGLLLTPDERRAVKNVVRRGSESVNVR